MRRIAAILLMLLLLLNTGIAEETRQFTADEQAYNAYLDITNAYTESVKYLKEFRELQNTSLALESVSDMDQYWFEYTFLTRAGSVNDERVPRLACFLSLAEEKYGLENYTDLYHTFMKLIVVCGNKTTSVVSAGLALAQESRYLKTAEDIQGYLDDAMNGIRTLMRIDREYPFLKDLQEYYKEAVLVSEYIDRTTDYYAEFSKTVDTYIEALRSWEIDFEFIFDPAGFSYVDEVRSARWNEERKQLYDQATVLEANGDYDGAIDLYWESRWEDAVERIAACHKAQEYAAAAQKYEEAASCQEAGAYRDAYSLFISLGDYMDSGLRAEECHAHFFSAKVTRGDFSYSIDFDCDANKNVIFKKENHSKWPKETVYEYENNKLVSSTETGIGSYTDGKVGSTTTTQTSYNEYGDPVVAYCQYQNASTGKNTVKLTTTWDYSYNDQGLKTAAMKNQETLSPDYTPKYEYNYEYENNRLTRENCYIANGDLQGELYIITTYEYDDSGRILCETSTYCAGDLDGFQVVTEYDYQ